MKHIWLLSLSLFLVLSLACVSSAQIQTAHIIVKGVSPDLKALGRYNALSSGLPNVGKGQKVWLEALALYTSGTNAINSWVDTILTETWSIVGPPGSLLTEPIHTDTTTYFIPDTTGQYQVNLSVTTSHGTKATSLYINSGKWVGVGGIVGPADFSKGECASCHSEKANTWKNTPHASMFSNGIDGKIVIPGLGAYYTSSCFSCHTTGYDKALTATNNGFDDQAATYGWSLPSPLQAGNWDLMKLNYPEVAKLGNIQCENCHGPGSNHYSLHDKNQIAISLSADVCGQCHGAKTHHVKNSEWNNSSHSASIAEGKQVEYMNRTSCARCHTGNGYLNETIDGQPSAAPYSDAQPVTCAVCHDPHDATNPGQLRSASIADACDGCHITRLSSFSGLHHSNQSPMLNGSNGTPYAGQAGPIGNWGGWQLPGYSYLNSSHSNITNRCAECHMATTTGGADTALVPVSYKQWQGQLGGHTFRVMWDRGTPDDKTDDILNPYGCKDCHGNVSLEFVDQSQALIHTLLDELRALLPHRTSGDTTAPKFPQDASLTSIQKVGAYNWYFVNNDGSYGVHNHKYAEALLRSSIEMLQLGVGAADIVSVKDVPNDQGKQVQIVWNKFPAESDPITPVTNYLVLRMDSASALAKTFSVAAKSFHDMLSKVSEGSKVLLGGSVWTKVGEYKAIGLAKYSLDVPTLYDSTAFDGAKYTTFEVVGYTASTKTYVSAPASGYSIDNLAPAPPTGFNLVSIGGVVNLTWSASNDADFKYFAVYRGITPNFNPNGTPLATVTNPQYADASVQLGRVYYYKLTAFDFSGNESDFSQEKSLTVTSVDEEGGIPKDFALRQNHPNPFNPTTHIRYELPQAEHVKISIYNTLGMLVTTLVDQFENAGYHTAIWDGIDNVGNSVATGIYLYKMETSSYTSIKKMMLIK